MRTPSIEHLQPILDRIECLDPIRATCRHSKIQLSLQLPRRRQVPSVQDGLLEHRVIIVVLQIAPEPFQLQGRPDNELMPVNKSVS